MKVDVTESDYELYIDIKPETVQELAMLFRATNNAKAQKPYITLSFNSSTPYCGISLQKVKPTVQRNSISNSKK